MKENGNGGITRNIYFTKEQDKLIQDYCRETGNNVSNFVRDLVYNFFKNRKGSK